MLTQTLRGLEDDGLVSRTVHREVPRKVEYALTPLGRTFLEPVAALCRWGQDHADDLEQVQANRKMNKRKK